MNQNDVRAFTAFEGTTRIARGDLRHVAGVVKGRYDRPDRAPILVFDDATAVQVDLDLGGTAEQVAARYEETTTLPEAAETTAQEGDLARRPGRPRLGVVAREVTLLPRHWEWLSDQPGGASVALRRLVEQARKLSADADRSRAARERAYRVMTALAGNLAGYEEATRALFRDEPDRLDELIRDWPPDLYAYLRELSGRVDQA
ncbi:DUF2239 family protein [Aquisphaera insulae]|uniref:DUF2239 family protein n=1 Tax=Aquisphaera insulae TaxID=2712864 RepID=UPI0013EA427A|nr:DUF2239 family protein [Aquisphaera insulae]